MHGLPPNTARISWGRSRNCPRRLSRVCDWQWFSAILPGGEVLEVENEEEGDDDDWFENEDDDGKDDGDNETNN